MLSAVVLSHNSQESIARTLESISFCDEIIVIDDDSTDQTSEQVKKFKAKFIKHPLDNDFSGQRNFGLNLTRGDWILFIDSDEVVSGQLKNEIIRVTKNSKSNQDQAKSTQINGYYIKRTDFLFGKVLQHGETGDCWLLRLARSQSGIWQEPVHEYWRISGKTERLSQPLNHYPHQKISDFLSSVNFYSTLRANYLKTQGVKVRFWHIIFYPTGKFIYNYFFKLGFLDGVSGTVVAVMMSFHSFLVRSKLFILWQKKSEIS